MKRGDAHSTLSFVLKQSFRSIQDAFHLLILQSLTAAQTLTSGIGIKGSNPKHLCCDPNLAKIPAFSTVDACMARRPGNSDVIAFIMKYLGF